MKVKGLVEEDFINYKNPSMFIATCYCDWKCCNDAKVDNSMCQNSLIAKQPNIEISVDEIFHRYTSNLITNSIVIGGLEPFLQFEEIYEMIKYFRNKKCLDDIVIYTGYYLCEIQQEVIKLKEFKNIILKTGRYIPNLKGKFDNVLGVKLVSANQCGMKIS